MNKGSEGGKKGREKQEKETESYKKGALKPQRNSVSRQDGTKLKEFILHINNYGVYWISSS